MKKYLKVKLLITAKDLVKHQREVKQIIYSQGHRRLFGYLNGKMEVHSDNKIAYSGFEVRRAVSAFNEGEV